MLVRIIKLAQVDGYVHEADFVFDFNHSLYVAFDVEREEVCETFYTGGGGGARRGLVLAGLG